MAKPTRAIRDTLTAISDMQAAQATLDKHRAARDAALMRAYLDDDLSAPEIARQTGLSLSNVRLIIKVANAARRSE